MSGGLLLDAGNTVGKIGAHLSDLLVAPEACYPYLESFFQLSFLKNTLPLAMNLTPAV